MLSGSVSPFSTPRLYFKTPRQSEIDSLKSLLELAEEDLRLSEDNNLGKERKIKELHQELSLIRELIERDLNKKKATRKIWRETCMISSLF